MSPAGCRLLLFWALLLLLATVNSQSPAAQPPKCGEIIGKLVVLNKTDACTVDPSIDQLGHRQHLAVLDFSRADPQTLNDFLGQKKSNNEYIFKSIHGAVLMDGNPDVETINFGEIGKLEGERIPPNGIFINICNNPKLKTINWPKLQRVHGPLGKDVFVFIYNNPSLELLAGADTFNQPNIISHIQQNPGECRFAHPVKLKKYTSPTDELLSKCQTIKGDLILENRAPKGRITLDSVDGACLRLFKVNMTSYQIDFPVGGKGLAECKDGRHSLIVGNINFCKDQLMATEQYFSDPTNVTILPDASCAAVCDNEMDVNHKYTLCYKVVGSYDIGSWFTDPKLVLKPRSLKKFSIKMSIANSAAKKINLLSLDEVTELYISGNDDLVDLNLPKLQKVEILTITDNPRLPFDVIKKLPAVKPKSFEIDCPTDENTVVTDLGDLALCTAIHGPLILDGLADVNETALQHVKVIEGCITVRNTSLTNLNFLENLTSHCNQEHLLEDNPNLCRRASLNGVAVVVNEKLRYKRCGASCKNILTKGCVKAYGDIKITGETPRSDLDELEYIEGSLTISGTDLSHLNFPKLEEITGPKGPLLRIVNNRDLISIQMPVIKKIHLATGGKGPHLQITGNSKLENVKFLPENLRRKCISDEETTCLYDGKNRAEKTSWTKFGIIGAVVGGFYLLLTAACLFLCCSQLVREARETEETRRLLAEKISNPRKEYNCPGSGNYWKHLVMGGDAGSVKSQPSDKKPSAKSKASVKSSGKSQAVAKSAKPSAKPPAATPAPPSEAKSKKQTPALTPTPATKAPAPNPAPIQRKKTSKRASKKRSRAPEKPAKNKNK